MLRGTKDWWGCWGYWEVVAKRECAQRDSIQRMLKGNAAWGVMKCWGVVKNAMFSITMFWSSQLHACCVRDTLQTSRDAFNLNQSLSDVEKLLHFVKFLHGISTVTMQPRNSPRGRCEGSKKHKTSPEMLIEIYRLSARNCFSSLN